MFHVGDIIEYTWEFFDKFPPASERCPLMLGQRAVIVKILESYLDQKTDSAGFPYVQVQWLDNDHVTAAGWYEKVSRDEDGLTVLGSAVFKVIQRGAPDWKV